MIINITRQHIDGIKKEDMVNRSTLDIASDVLKAANGGASKIKIMYGAFLCYKQMKEYVNFLTEKGLLVIDNKDGEAQVFKTTEKGLRFLEIHNRLDEMIKEEEEQLAPILYSQMGSK
jgi:predicted transcriptional regulator